MASILSIPLTEIHLFQNRFFARVRSFTGQSKQKALIHRSYCSPDRGALLGRQSNNLIGKCSGCRMVSTKDVGQHMGYRIHQRGGVADVAGILKRAVDIRSRGLGIAKHP